MRILLMCLFTFIQLGYCQECPPTLLEKLAGKVKPKFPRATLIAEIKKVQEQILQETLNKKYPEAIKEALIKIKIDPSLDSSTRANKIYNLLVSEGIGKTPRDLQDDLIRTMSRTTILEGDKISASTVKVPVISRFTDSEWSLVMTLPKELHNTPAAYHILFHEFTHFIHWYRIKHHLKNTNISDHKLDKLLKDPALDFMNEAIAMAAEWNYLREIPQDDLASVLTQIEDLKNFDTEDKKLLKRVLQSGHEKSSAKAHVENEHKNKRYHKESFDPSLKKKLRELMK